MNKIFGLLLFLPVSAFAADILTTWQPVTTDDAGNPLPGGVTIEEYRVKDCTDVQLGTVTPPATLEFREIGAADSLSSGDTVCRRVVAYIAPFEGADADGVFVALVPGQTSVNVQATP